MLRRKQQHPKKSSYELKMQAQDDIQNNTYSGKQNIKLKGRFDNKLFNKIYEENRLNVNDDGYGEWMKSNFFDSADVKRSEVFGNKFNLVVFNNVFSQQDTSNNGALVVSNTSNE